MPRLSTSKLSATLIWSLLALYALWQVVTAFLPDFDYSLTSERASPDGKMTIYEFHSLQDGQGHAPYGTLLSLSLAGKIKQPSEGYVFFAGYCASPLQYRWLTNEKIMIACQSRDSANPVRTLAASMYGITVELSTH